jgi:hypothetical protein
MDALTAIGLAGNIVQFVDFSCKLFVQSRELHNSSSGISKSGADLILITKSLHEHCQVLARANQTLLTYRPEHAPMYRLAANCQQAEAELLSAVHSITSRGDRSRWNSFCSALEMTWKKEKILDMERRLDQYRSELILQLEILLRYVDSLSARYKN